MKRLLVFAGYFFIFSAASFSHGFPRVWVKAYRAALQKYGHAEAVMIASRQVPNIAPALIQKALDNPSAVPQVIYSPDGSKMFVSQIPVLRVNISSEEQAARAFIKERYGVKNESPIFRYLVHTESFNPITNYGDLTPLDGGHYMLTAYNGNEPVLIKDKRYFTAVSGNAEEIEKVLRFVETLENMRIFGRSNVQFDVPMITSVSEVPGAPGRLHVFAVPNLFSVKLMHKKTMLRLPHTDGNPGSHARYVYSERESIKKEFFYGHKFPADQQALLKWSLNKLRQDFEICDKAFLKSIGFYRTRGGLLGVNFQASLKYLSSNPDENPPLQDSDVQWFLDEWKDFFEFSGMDGSL